MTAFIGTVPGALPGARRAVLSVWITYAASILVGILMVHAGEAVLDVARIYLPAIPVLLAGSLWEFLSAWNA
jgi:hypothetical protein